MKDNNVTLLAFAANHRVAVDKDQKAAMPKQMCCAAILSIPSALGARAAAAVNKWGRQTDERNTVS